MPKITVMMDGAVLDEVKLTKERTTIGRRPYNDVVLENLTVSGEHAVLTKSGDQVSIEDLHSTNGTYIGGKAVKQQILSNGDVLELGKYHLRFESEAADGAFDKTMLVRPGVAASGPISSNAPVSVADLRGVVKVISGPAAGREMALTKIVTTVGKPGISIASITQRRSNFFVHHVEGNDRATVNGEAIGSEPVMLSSGDKIMLAGTEMQFLQG